MSGEGAYVSTREAAELLGVSLRTAQLWVENGVLLAWKTDGGHRRILLHSIEKILNERKKIFTERAPFSAKNLRVVVVEDDADLLKLLKMTILDADSQIQIQTATDGFLGLVMVGEFKPHILIADLNMPNMDGFLMLRAIEVSEFAPQRIIVTTALSEDSIAAKGGLPERVTILEKPFSFEKLKHLILEFSPNS
jgi:excisionase family DNA binding protein